jgi:hypothetical protein
MVEVDTPQTLAKVLSDGFADIVQRLHQERHDTTAKRNRLLLTLALSPVGSIARKPCF